MHSPPVNRFTREGFGEREPGSQQFPPWLRIIRARLKTFPEGEHVAAAVSRHFSEVRRLINSNRRIATMWHRATGPFLLRQLLQGALDPEGYVATADPSERQYLDRFFDQLRRYGSRRLRDRIDRYRSAVFALIETPLAAMAHDHQRKG